MMTAWLLSAHMPMHWAYIHIFHDAGIQAETVLGGCIPAARKPLIWQASLRPSVTLVSRTLFFSLCNQAWR